MKLGQRDLKRLALPLLGMLLLLAAAMTLVWLTQQQADKAEHDLAAANATRQQLEQRLRQVRNEEMEVKSRAQSLQDLQARGVAGEEKRLDWMELLRRIQEELRIPGMKYEFGAQMPLDKGTNGSVVWYASPMRLQMRLLHEGDLLDILDRIEHDAGALVLVRGCRLTTLSKAADTPAWGPQLSADCELQWLTVRIESLAK